MKTLGWWHGIPGTLDRHFACSVEMPQPTDSFLIVFRQNKCNVADPQAEAPPFCTPCMQRALSCQLGLFLLRQSTPVSSFNQVIVLVQLMQLTHCVDKRKASQEPEQSWACSCFPLSQHPEEEDAQRPWMGGCWLPRRPSPSFRNLQNQECDDSEFELLKYFFIHCSLVCFF